MAARSRMNEELVMPRKSWTRNHKTGNENLIINNGGSDRSPVCIKPKSKSMAASAVVPTRKVPVLYYLSRNGHLEHPHLIDVPLSSPHGLYLKDVMNTLNSHRGKGIANIYSWSFKRSYKSGYVWHDASEDDLIQPTNGHDYVIKGSERLQTPQNQSETYHPGHNCTSTTTAAAMVIRRNQSWSSFENPREYSVVKCESNRELAAKFVPDTAAQTEEHRRQEHVTVELSADEIPSPRPSNSSSEVSEAVNRSSCVDRSARVRDVVPAIEHRNGSSGRMKVSQVLMQLVTCGVDSVRHERSVKGEQDQGCQVGGVCGKSLKSETFVNQ